MSREEAVARNEALFREINMRIAELEQAWGIEEIHFVCECGRAKCFTVMPMTMEEYKRLRSDPMRFAVLPGHEMLEFEDVVDAGERGYLIVQKHEETKSIVAPAEDAGPT